LDDTTSTDAATPESGDEIFSGTVVVNSCDGTKSPCRAVFEINQAISLIPKITYQAMIPNGSKVFRIISTETVEDLIAVLESGTTSLTDRDEEGRSLLNVSLQRLYIRKELTLS
jgi:hypothetical protein